MGTTRGDRTRTAVVEAARAAFAADGFDRSTGARIAAAAGVSEPTIAHHFGSKAGLLVAVMRAHYDLLVEEMDGVVESAGSPEDRLRAVATWWPATSVASWDLLSVFGRQGRRGGDEEVLAAFVECNRLVTRRLDRLLQDCRAAGVLRADAPLRELRDAFFGGLEHLLLARDLTGRPEDLGAAAERLVDLLLRGAAPDPTPPPADDRLRRLERRVEELHDLLAGGRADPDGGRA